MDAQASSEGRLVNSNTRNARVVACLILAMTAGARILLWLEPAPAVADRVLPLAAVSGTPVEDILIEYAQPGDLPAPGLACLIWPDGRTDGEQRGPSVWLVVVGSDGEQLPEVQKQKLLAALGTLTWGQTGSDASTLRIRLHPNSDFRGNPTLRPQARELGGMLVSKRLID